jgi:hypothetical protein
MHEFVNQDGADMRGVGVQLGLVVMAAMWLGSPALSQPAAPIEVWRAPEEMWRNVQPAPDPNREWTLLVYLDADNNLENSGLDDLKEMERGLPERGVEVIVLIDRAKGYDQRFDDWTGARLYRVRRSTRPDAIGSELLADLGELDMGKRNTLWAFVEGGLRRFPARRHGVVMWNHGGGWAALASDDDAPGANDGQSALRLDDVGSALAGALSATGVPRLDLIGFDMCLMSQAESAIEMAPFARVMVGSQAIEPGDGWPYDRVLPELGDTSLATATIAERIVKHYQAHFAGRRDTGVTQSAVDLDRAEELRLALDALGRKLQASMDQSWSPLTRAIFFSQAYWPRNDFRKGKSAVSSIDLTDMAQRVKRLLPGVADAEADRVVAAVKAAVLASSTADLYRFSYGLSVYGPPSAQQFDDAYGATRLAKTTAWPAVLRSLFDLQAARLTAPNIAALKAVRLRDGAPIRSADIGGGYGIQATIEGHNVLWVEMYSGPFLENSNDIQILTKGYMLDPMMISRRPQEFADLVDFAMPQLDKERNELAAEFLGARFVIGNGEQYAAATIDTSDLGDTRHFVVKVGFNRVDGSAHSGIVKIDALTLRSTVTVAELPLPDGRYTYREFRPDPNDVVTLYIATLNLNGNEAWVASASFPWRNGLDARLVNDQPGEIAIAVRAESIGGASAVHATSLRARPLTEASADHERRAKLLQPNDLLGTWDWYLIGPNGAEPQFRNMTVTAGRDGPQFTLDGPGPAGAAPVPQQRGTLHLDTMFTPSLRLLALDEHNAPVTASGFIARVLPNPQGAPLISLKYLNASGLLFAIYKREGTGVASTSGAFAPLPAAVAPVAPAVNAGALLGQWRAADGTLLWFAQAQYALYQGGQLTEQGSYATQGDFLYMVRPNGVQSVLGVALQGTALHLRDHTGAIYSYARVQ